MRRKRNGKDLYDFLYDFYIGRVIKKNSHKTTFNLRFKDLLKLLELRNYDIDDHERQRREGVYLYTKKNHFFYDLSFYSVLKYNRDEIIDFCLELNRKIYIELEEKELKRIVSNGFNNGNKYMEFIMNNEIINDSNISEYIRLIKVKKNYNQVKYYDISEDEQKEMELLAIGEIKKNKVKERHKKVRDIRRRNEGMIPREEYLKQCNKKTQNNIHKIKSLLRNNPKMSQRALAKELGISSTRINQLLKILNSNS